MVRDGSKQLAQEGLVSLMETCELTTGAFIRELEKNGRRHRWYFHYTGCDTLQRICDNGKLFLSPVAKMNDGKEAKMVPDNMFAACFSYGSAESVAMWNTYGIPRRDAVRLCFDGALMRRLLDGDFGPLKCQALNKDRTAICDIPPEKVKVTLVDIAYASVDGKYCRYRDRRCIVIDEKGRDQNLLGSKFAGYVKMEGWSYEREARLLLTVAEDYVVPDISHVAVDFSGVVKGITANTKIHGEYPILFGPWATPDKCEELAKQRLKVGKSAFTGYLDNLKTVCDKCGEACRRKCRCKHKDAR